MINRSNIFFIKYPYIPIYYIPIISLLYNVIAADDREKLNSPNNLVNFRSVVDLTLLMIILGSIGCFYVFYRVYKQWILNKKRLGMIYKLPYYTAWIDLLLNLSFFVNIMHTAMTAQVWGEPTCKLLSALYWTFMSTNLCFYVVIAVQTYLRICHEKYFDTGRNDCKLWIIVIVLSIIIQLINMPNHGARKYWCAGRAGQVRSPMILFIIITISLLIVCFCYMRILLKIVNVQKRPITTTLSKDSDNENGIGNDVLEQRAEIERRAAKKIMSYVLVFIIQWVPIQISAGARFFSNDHIWVYIVASIGRSFGGIGNAIQYIINEGWITRESTEYDKYDTTKSQETDNRTSSLNNDNYKLITLNDNNNNTKNMENTGNKIPIITIGGSNQG